MPNREGDGLDGGPRFAFFMVHSEAMCHTGPGNGARTTEDDMHASPKLPSLILALVGLWIPAQAAVALSEFGARASASTATCPSFCTDFEFAMTEGGVGSLFADTGLSDFRGNAAAQVTLDGSSGLSMPELKAEAYVTGPTIGGGVQSSAFGTAFGVEGYTYQGLGPKTFNLDVDLTGQVVDSTPADGDTDIVADIYIFAESNFLFISDIGTLVFEAGATEITSTRLRLTAGQTQAQDTLTFDLSPGESIYLWALLSADAERDLSFADAFSTVTTAFQDQDGLTSASGGLVPEPALIGLLALGIAATLRRRESF